MREIVISETEISEYVYKALIDLGYAPKEDETDDIASILFDYLFEIGVIAEIEEETD